jgi:hypothetical protein
MPALMMEALQWKLLVLLDEPLGAQSSEQVPRRPQPMMPLAQLRASWKELPSSSQAHLLLLVQLLLSQPLELRAQIVQKLLLLAVSSGHQPLVVSLDLQSLAESWDPQQLMVVLELHHLGEAATICCVHSLAFQPLEPHWVAEASLFLGKTMMQRARQLRRPEMWIQFFRRFCLVGLHKFLNPNFSPAAVSRMRRLIMSTVKVGLLFSIVNRDDEL